MTKVVIVGEMTLGESFAPPGFPGQLPSPGPGGPIDPGFGNRPGAIDPGFGNRPGGGLPPIPDHGLPPPDLGPGEIWPPLPPGTKPTGKAYAILAVPGVGYRYTVIDLSVKPGHDLPGNRPHPGHELPDAPEHKPSPEPEPGASEPKHRR